MASILETLIGQLGKNEMKGIARQIGADQGTTSTAVSAALPMLFSALNRNAGSGDGAEALSSALAKDHDGGILDDIMGFVGQAQSGPGAKILSHVLGAKQGAVQTGLSKSTGMGSESMGKLLVTLAPMVMGALGRQKRQGNLDAQGIAGMLQGERRNVERQAPKQLGLLDSLLDSDRDGDVDTGDIAKGAIGMLGKLFGGK